MLAHLFTMLHYTLVHKCDLIIRNNDNTKGWDNYDR